MRFEQIMSNEVLDIRDGTHESPKYKDTGYPLITSKNLKHGRIDFSDVNFISEEDYISINKRSKVNKGDVLYSMIGSIGNYAFVDNEPNYAIKNVALFRFTDKRLHNKFFLHLINSSIFQRQIEQRMKGGTQKFVSLKILRNLKIPLPPIEEQKKIAAILDAAADYRQKTKALIEKYDQLTQSLFLDMFGHLLQTQSNTITLEELCGKGKYGSGASAIEYDDSLPRYVRITDINESGDLNDKKMSPSEFDEQYILKNHDLLFARTGATVGKTYLYKESDGELIYAGYLIKFKIPKPHNALYFFHFTKTNYYKSWVDNQQNVVAQPNINARQYGNELAIPLPSIELQNQFAERVAQVEQQKQQAEAALVKAEDLFNSLLQKAFKGELTN